MCVNVLLCDWCSCNDVRVQSANCLIGSWFPYQRFVPSRIMQHAVEELSYSEQKWSYFYL